MDASQFESRADATLARLEQALEASAGDGLDIELVGGILTLELEAGGIYQINKHSPNREIWLSSPVSGAWHFAWHETRPAMGVWRSTRGRGAAGRPPGARAVGRPGRGDRAWLRLPAASASG